MARTTQFDHDRLSHLLADKLLEVPRFQRNYSWDTGNVQEFLDDLHNARRKGVEYFMGTVVFAEGTADSSRLMIVDGQQRLATTALLLIAIRDVLDEYGKAEQAKYIDETYLRGYDLDAEEVVERLILNPADQEVYGQILQGDHCNGEKSALYACYETCIGHLRLLKNFLFSQAGAHFGLIERTWIEIESSFDRPDDLVKFIRHEFASRNGKVSTRKLYRSLQSDIGSGPGNAKRYATSLKASHKRYLALRDPDNVQWDALNFDVRDALLAFGRFQFESSMPLLLAAFRMWEFQKAAKLLNKVAGWSVRAQFAGRLGASLAEESFCAAASAVSQGQAKTQVHVLEALDRLVPTDSEFEVAFGMYGAVSVSRAKYLLAMLERAARISRGESVDGLPDWSSKGVTIEHIHPQSAARASADSPEAPLVHSLGNLALLEKGLNRGLDSKPFEEKRATYAGSSFSLTGALSSCAKWDADEISSRSTDLSKLAALAWPLR